MQAHTFNTILASNIYKELEPGEKREVGFDEVAGTMGDFVLAATQQGLEIMETTSNAVTLRKPYWSMSKSMSGLMRAASGHADIRQIDDGLLLGGGSDWEKAFDNFEKAIAWYMQLNDEYEGEWDYEGMFDAAATEVTQGWIIPNCTDLDAIIGANHPDPLHNDATGDVTMARSEMEALWQENADLREENAALGKQIQSLRRQIKSYQDATRTLTAILNNS